MRRCLFYIIILIFLGACVMSEKHQPQDCLTDFVDPFIGTDGPGNTYPGVAMPFGMVQLSPDNGLQGWDRIAGYYWQDSTIAGFSHKHLSGTGAGDLYDVLVMPMNSRFNEDLWPDKIDYRPFSKFSHKHEKAWPGYYSVDLLSSGIKVELTATDRVGMHRYTFPEDDSTRIIVDLGFNLNWDKAVESSMEWKDEKTLVGYRFSRGWAPDQREFFVIHFSKPMASCKFYSDNQPVGGKSVKGEKTKVVLNFPSKEGEQLLLKVALSSHSIEGANRNMEKELPGWGFDQLVEDARQRWEEQLSCIHVAGELKQKRIFYSNLYHCFLTPSLHSDVDGWYKGADSTYHQAIGYNKFDTFSLWDTYRTAHPLYTILVPEKVEDFIKSFLSHYDETGLLPVWSFVGNETNMMIGYHSVPVIVDAYLKGIPMDVEKAFEACVQTARSDAWDLSSYKKLGYVPADMEGGQWSVSKTLEYAYDDWCIAQFAKALNNKEEYAYFIKRSKNWKNLYDPSTTFMRPKDETGKFVYPFLPKKYTEYFCESNGWQYFWHVQHDLNGLIDTVGKEAFAAKLDSMFSYAPEEGDSLPIFSTGMIGQYAHGNEPSHHVGWLYNLLDEPHKTQNIVNQIIESQYSDSPDGYCGNEDCGQMSSWLVMSSLGIYPVNPADGCYHLNSPWFEKAVVNLPNGKQLVIKTQNYKKGVNYIQTVWFNGIKLDALILKHSDLINGGVLEFVFDD